MRHTKSWPAALFALSLSAAAFAAAPSKHGAPKMPVLSSSGAPAGAVLLFTGKQDDVSANWVRRGSSEPGNWKVQDGAMVSEGGDIATREKFKDFYLHLEFNEPYVPDQKGQGRGNSGVGLQGLYEIQILDSYGIKEPGTGDCGSVYSQSAPLVNACKPPKTWQTYDIVFRSARFNASGEKTEPGRVTVLQNGIVVQNNTVLAGTTGIAGGMQESAEPGPIVLQFHHNALQFRNVWLVPLPEKGADHYEGR